MHLLLNELDLDRSFTINIELKAFQNNQIGPQSIVVMAVLHINVSVVALTLYVNDRLHGRIYGILNTLSEVTEYV